VAVDACLVPSADGLKLSIGQPVCVRRHAWHYRPGQTEYRSLSSPGRSPNNEPTSRGRSMSSPRRLETHNLRGFRSPS
jgi:hypothetical protein